MVMVVNRAPGPRLFNVKGGVKDVALQVVLAPGESRDLDLVSQDEPVLKGWIENDEVLLGDEAAKFLKRKQPSAAEVDQKIAELRLEMAKLEAMRDGVDPSLITPPHQLGGDGGPEQQPTVGGRDGAPTPAQGDGTPAQKAKETPVAHRATKA